MTTKPHHIVFHLATVACFCATPAFGQEMNAQLPSEASSQAYRKGCYPELNEYGIPYPVCPKSIRDTKIISRIDERVVIDATTDTYHRLNDKLRDEGQLNEREWDEVTERVRDGRLHAEGEVQATLDIDDGGLR